MHSVVVEIENERGRVRWTLGVFGWLLLAGTFPAFAQPSADEIEVAGVAYTVEVERHNGYEAIPWSQVPESVVSGSFQRDGAATGQVAGASLELRSGSPFGRHGDSVFQLTNPPIGFRVRCGFPWSCWWSGFRACKRHQTRPHLPRPHRRWFGPFQLRPPSTNGPRPGRDVRVRGAS